MNKSLQRLCLTAAVAFVVGCLIGHAFYISIRINKAKEYGQPRIEATYFFYHTMISLFEGTYNPEEGSVSPAALERFEEYKPQLGGKCELFIVDSTPGYYECFALFPSGDIFSFALIQQDGRWELAGFIRQDWEKSWRETLYRYHTKRNSDQPK